jgi:two-component system sensor histidine kinase RegB
MTRFAVATNLDRLSVNAAWLMQLRWVAVTGQLLTIGIAHFVLHIALRLLPLLIGVGFTAATNLAFAWWLRRIAGRATAAPSDARWHQVFVGLMFLDLIVLTLLLYFTGGLANPFSIFFLVNVALSGILLPVRWVWPVNLLSMACVTALAFWHLPLAWNRVDEQAFGHSSAAGLTLADYGTIVAFAACASVIVYFTTRLTLELERRDDELRRATLRQVRSEKWESLGTLAAGAAHELSTPLSTIAVVAKELQHEIDRHQVSDAVGEDIQTIRSELDRCRAILDRMSVGAGHATGESLTWITLEKLVHSTLRELGTARGRVQVKIPESNRRHRLLAPPVGLAQALRGLVQNALDASEDGHDVDLICRAEAEALILTVRDRGGGMPPEVLERADEPFFTTKAPGKGMGLGRFLARTVIERLDGRVETRSIVGKGTDVIVTLPRQPDPPNQRRE